jgi:uroporphyrinogen-III synthase
MSALAGIRIVAFEARRADELATMLGRHGADVMRAPALREVALAPGPEAIELHRRLADGTIAAAVLLTGVGTRALAAVLAGATPAFTELLARVPIVARGPKPLAALRELGVPGARAVPPPFTWREALVVVDTLALRPGATVAVQEYGVPATGLTAALAERGLSALRVPVYRWAMPDDVGPLRAAVAALGRGALDVAVFTNSAQVEHLFRVGDADALRAQLAHAVIASVGPVCSETLEAHGVRPDLEPTPPKMGPLVALVAEHAAAVLARKRGTAAR